MAGADHAHRVGRPVSWGYDSQGIPDPLGEGGGVDPLDGLLIMARSASPPIDVTVTD